MLGVDKDENLLVVEGAVPGPKDGYVVITKAKKPPRERRGFAGGGTVDPLKASKRAAKGKKVVVVRVGASTLSGPMKRVGDVVA